MDALPEFQVLHPTTVDEVMAARREHPESRMIGGGTDLLVNIRRGIETPPVLIDTGGLDELKAIEVSADAITIGASVRLAAYSTYRVIKLWALVALR